MTALTHWLRRTAHPNGPGEPPAPLRLFQQGRRLVEALLRDVTEGGLDLRATSLVYTTLLSLAPLLAVSFSVLKAFGAHNQLQPFLRQMLAPLGAEAPEVTDRIIGFVDNLEVGVLGFTGFALLFWTVLSLLQKIEDTFNQIWRVRKARSLRRRFSEYLSVLLVGPVLVFSALGLMASMASHRVVQTIIALEPFGTLYLLLVKILPTLFMIAAFTFLYLFIPNTRVSLRAALIGGVAAGLAWRLAGWLFGVFVAGSAYYAGVYSGFAILIVFMIWLYVNWLVLLLGVDISFYVQNPRHLRLKHRDLRLGSATFRRTGLLVMYLLAERFQRGGAPWTLSGLTARLDLPHQTVEHLLETLRQRGLVLATADEESGYLPAREPCVTPVAEILEALDAEPEDGQAVHGPALAEPAVDRVLERLRKAGGEAVEGLNLKDWVVSAGEARDAPPEAGPADPSRHGPAEHR